MSLTMDAGRVQGSSVWVGSFLKIKLRQWVSLTGSVVVASISGTLQTVVTLNSTKPSTVLPIRFPFNATNLLFFH